MISYKLLNSVKENEGFRSKPYQDTKGIWTIGHGLTYITEEESARIVIGRLERLGRDLQYKTLGMSEARENIIVEMAYQMGLGGVMAFHKMWEAIDCGNYDAAADEMLDSKWAKRDSPNRAKRMAAAFREG